MGQQAGEVLPAAFLPVADVANSPQYRHHHLVTCATHQIHLILNRYSYGVGFFVMLFFSWVLGYLVTQAEPALHVMGDQVQEIGLMRYYFNTYTRFVLNIHFICAFGNI